MTSLTHASSKLTIDSKDVPPLVDERHATRSPSSWTEEQMADPGFWKTLSRNPELANAASARAPLRVSDSTKPSPAHNASFQLDPDPPRSEKLRSVQHWLEKTRPQTPPANAIHTHSDKYRASSSHGYSASLEDNDEIASSVTSSSTARPLSPERSRNVRSPATSAGAHYTPPISSHLRDESHTRSPARTARASSSQTNEHGKKTEESSVSSPSEY